LNTRKAYAQIAMGIRDGRAAPDRETAARLGRECVWQLPCKPTHQARRQVLRCRKHIFKSTVHGNRALAA
jgi:hypothetical protein